METAVLPVDAAAANINCLRRTASRPDVLWSAGQRVNGPYCYEWQSASSSCIPQSSGWTVWKQTPNLMGLSWWNFCSTFLKLHCCTVGKRSIWYKKKEKKKKTQYHTMIFIFVLNQDISFGTAVRATGYLCQWFLNFLCWGHLWFVGNFRASPHPTTVTVFTQPKRVHLMLALPTTATESVIFHSFIHSIHASLAMALRPRQVARPQLWEAVT